MHRNILAISLFTTFCFIGCSTPEKTKEPSAQWIGNMHKLSQLHLELMPLVANRRDFANPKNKAEIQRDLKEMVSAAADAAHDPKAPKADPLIEYTATRFAVEARQAYAAFQVGDLQGARFALSHISDYCINCHTRANRGARDFPLTWQPELHALNTEQKIEFLLANRQYTSASQLAKTLVNDKNSVRLDPRSWQLSLARVMAMTVRVNNDPVKAEELASAVLANSGAPFYLRSDAAAWLKDIHTWQKEKAPRTEAEKYRLAVNLETKSYSDHSDMSGRRLVASLRASALLHELLENTKSPHYGEYLLHAGIVSKYLRDINMGYLDQYYFEDCIRWKPHSELAESCYVLYERASVEANPLIELEPDGASAMESRLSDLRQLAERNDTDVKPTWKSRLWDYNLNEDEKPIRKRGGQ